MSSARNDPGQDTNPVVARASDLLIREGEFGVVIASRNSGTPITLGGSARAVWAVLDTPYRVADAVDEVAHRSGVAASAIRSDVEQTIQRLIALDVVKRQP